MGFSGSFQSEWGGAEPSTGPEQNVVLVCSCIGADTCCEELSIWAESHLDVISFVSPCAEGEGEYAEETSRSGVVKMDFAGSGLSGWKSSYCVDRAIRTEGDGTHVR